MTPPPVPVLPKGWQWGKPAKALPSPQSPMPMNPYAAHRFAVCMGFANEKAPVCLPEQVSRPTWTVVSWKNLASRKIVGTQKEVAATVERALAAAGIHHFSITAYDAIHVIVALQD
jgi:hypothetical protein